eukprot:CAMPEP_0170454482 /NCGR_PEP_ID=MMETSP0123-20130129/2721_1 /TAXON_ID=182087 /ORGANISM="Favella ehrenbergii, Strain Fehren 1" /LENGTH=144 /DNA_ID=CAMNT_0010717213 /DNA_START=140 /DNA_END=574 /DNA_ORIENTATION=-
MTGSVSRPANSRLQQDSPELPFVVHETMDEHLNASYGTSAAVARKRNLDIKQNFMSACDESEKRNKTGSRLSRNPFLSQSVQVTSSLKHYTRFDAPKPNGKALIVTEKEWRYSTGDKIPSIYESIGIQNMIHKDRDSSTLAEPF